MRKRLFIKSDGTRERVPLKEYDRRKKIQRKALERSGKKVWEDRRGRQYGVTQERLERLERKRSVAKVAPKIGWDTASAIVDAKKTEGNDGRVRTYPGPTLKIESSIDEGIFHARLLDSARLAVEIDGRQGELYVSATCASTIFKPEAPDGEPGSTSFVPLFTVVDQMVTRIDKEAAVEALSRLNKGIKGVERESPKKQDPSAEVIPGILISGDEPEEEKGPRFAEPGYWGIYTSQIVIRGIKR